MSSHENTKKFATNEDKFFEIGTQKKPGTGLFGIQRTTSATHRESAHLENTEIHSKSELTDAEIAKRNKKQHEAIKKLGDEYVDNATQHVGDYVVGATRTRYEKSKHIEAASVLVDKDFNATNVVAYKDKKDVWVCSNAGEGITLHNEKLANLIDSAMADAMKGKFTDAEAKTLKAAQETLLAEAKKHHTGPSKGTENYTLSDVELQPVIKAYELFAAEAKKQK